MKSQSKRETMFARDALLGPDAAGDAGRTLGAAPRSKLVGGASDPVPPPHHDHHHHDHHHHDHHHHDHHDHHDHPHHDHHHHDHHDHPHHDHHHHDHHHHDHHH